MCVCAGQGWTLFRNEPQSKVNFLSVYDLTQDTHISLLLKIHCQKPLNMLNRSHRIQSGSRASHCVAGAKPEVLWRLVFVLMRSHIAKPFFELKGLWVGCFMPLFLFTTSFLSSTQAHFHFCFVQYLKPLPYFFSNHLFSSLNLGKT